MSALGKNILSIKGIAILLAIIFTIYLGYSYRIRQYKIIPPVNYNFDEVGYLWIGKSLLTTGIPATWSALSFYLDYDSFTRQHGVSVNGYNLEVDQKIPTILSWNKFPKPITKSQEISVDNYRSGFRLVQPYLDNPPLMGIILALADPGKSVFDSTVANVRLVPIILLSLTIGTIFLLGLLMSNFWSGFIASLIYAVGPGFVVTSRLALPENIFAALFPVLLLALFYYLRSPKKYLLGILIAASFLMPLFKVSGVILPLTIASVLVFHKHHRPALGVLASMALGFGAYLFYGFYYQADLFIKVLTAQGGRNFSGPLGILIKVLFPQTPLPMYEGWVLLGFSAALLLMRLKSLKFAEIVTFSVVVHLLFFTFFGGDNFPAYLFITFPLLALSLGILIEQGIRQPKLSFNLLFFFVVFSSMLHYSRWQLSFLNYLTSYRILVLVFVITPLILWLVKRPNSYLLKFSLIIMFVLSLWLSTKITNNMQSLWPYLDSLQYPLRQPYHSWGIDGF